MTIRKLAAVLLMTAATFGATSAFATDYKTTITLALGNNGALANESYTLTVPESLNVSQKGWNAMDGIHVVKDDTDFNTGKQLVVTASSTNSFALKSDENSISYTLTTEENGTQTTEWTFSAAEINADGGTTKPIGITVNWDETQAAGTYTDEITYTVAIQDAGTTATTTTVTWTGNDITNQGSDTSFTKDGVTITAVDIDFNDKTFENGGTFTTTLGNFTKIAVSANDAPVGEGWSGGTWTGTAFNSVWTGTASNSVAFTGNIGGISTIVFTIEQL